MSGANRGAVLETVRKDPNGDVGAGPLVDIGVGKSTDPNPNPNPNSDPPNPTAGKGHSVDPNGTGHRPVVRRSIQKPPEALWYKPDDWFEQTDGFFNGIDPSEVFVHLVRQGDEYQLWFNEGHGLFIDQRGYYGRWVSEKSAAMRRLPIEEIEQAVKQAYELDTIGRVFATMKRLKPHKTQKMFDDNNLALTVGAEGYQNVDQNITTDLGGRAAVLAAGKKAS